MAWSAEKQRAHRATLRAKGICQKCHKRKAVKGITICEVCRIDAMARSAAERARAKIEGLCHECRRREQTPGYVTCSRCREVVKKAQRRLTAGYRQTKDRCHNCGLHLDEFTMLCGRVVCNNCTTRKAREKARRRMRL